MKQSLITSAVICAVCFAGGVGIPASADAQSTSARQQVSVSTVDAYIQQSQVTQRKIDMAMAPIKSFKQLNDYMATTQAKQSALNKLSPGAKARFISSLKFNAKGLTTFRYTDLAAELTPTEIYRVLSLFGVQSSTPLLKGAQGVTLMDKEIMASPALKKDHFDYWCSSRATCSWRINTICTSNC